MYRFLLRPPCYEKPLLLFIVNSLIAFYLIYCVCCQTVVPVDKYLSTTSSGFWL
jgi:hypothetical protein